jgi:hypothetical protein
MLDNTSLDHCATQVSGRRVAHLKRNAAERAFVRGEVLLRKLTITQAAELLKVCPAYVQAALKADAYKRFSVVQGCEPLIPSKPKAKSESLAARLMRATPAERVAAAREVGVGVIWDEMLMPALS